MEKNYQNSAKVTEEVHAEVCENCLLGSGVFH